MKDIDKHVEELILYSSNYIINNAHPAKAVLFDFRISKTEKYMNHPDGEDLKNFKIKNKLTNNETIRKALQKNNKQRIF